jgi:hypothetical protein
VTHTKRFSAGADAHQKTAETRMDAVSHGGGGRGRARHRTRLTDADYAAIVKRYEDAGDVQNADIIRRQWEVVRASGHCKIGGGTMSSDAFLSRLNLVRKTGNGRWVCRCPAHDDRSPSLSVRELDDGRVLLHCFAGCEVQSILNAVGLAVEDLFPERIGGDSVKRERRPFNAADVLRCLSFEALILCQYASSLAKGEVLTPDARERLLTAATRLQHGAEVTHA